MGVFYLNHKCKSILLFNRQVQSQSVILQIQTYYTVSLFNRQVQFLERLKEINAYYTVSLFIFLVNLFRSYIK